MLTSVFLRIPLVLVTIYIITVELSLLALNASKDDFLSIEGNDDLISIDRCGVDQAYDDFSGIFVTLRQFFRQFRFLCVGQRSRRALGRSWRLRGWCRGGDGVAPVWAHAVPTSNIGWFVAPFPAAAVTMAATHTFTAVVLAAPSRLHILL